MILISIYVLFAAGAPVWLILQPRDFINVQILYGGVALMVLSLFRHGLRRDDGHGPGIQPPRRRRSTSASSGR